MKRLSERRPGIREVLLLCLLCRHLDGQQVARIVQLYPAPTTASPASFTKPMTVGGLYIAQGSVYIHAEDAPAPASIRAFKSDGAAVIALDSLSPNTKALLQASDFIVSFGATADIRRFKLLYMPNSFFQLDTTQRVGHNLNFLAGTADPSSALMYLSTSVSGSVYCYDANNLNFEVLSVLFAEFSTQAIRSIELMDGATLAIGGAFADIYFLQKATLGKIKGQLLPTSNTLRMFADKSSFAASPPVDVLTNGGLLLGKYSFDTPTPSLLASKLFLAAVKNIVSLPTVNYYLVAGDLSMEILKITTLASLDTLTLAGTTSSSVACCEVVNSKFVYSVPYFPPSTPNPLLHIYRSNVDFCTSYSSASTCSDCFIGYKLTNTTAGNKCIAEDEFPPRTGAKGRTIAECADNNCLACKKNNLKCEVCPAGHHISLENFKCIKLGELRDFGEDPSNSSLANRCTQLFCKRG